MLKLSYDHTSQQAGTSKTGNDNISTDDEDDDNNEYDDENETYDEEEEEDDNKSKVVEKNKVQSLKKPARAYAWAGLNTCMCAYKGHNPWHSVYQKCEKRIMTFGKKEAAI